MWSIDSVKSFCINLDKRTERWERMIAQPETKRIPNLKRFSAVNGSAISIDTDTRVSTLCRFNIKNHTRRSHDMLDSIGGVGCALSHITLWQNLVKSHENVFFIVEDDLVLKPGDWARIRRLYEENEWLHDSNNWSIWSVGNLRCRAGPNTPYPDEGKKENKWLKCKEFVGFNSYFISRTGAQKLLTECFPIQHHIDWFAGFYAQTHPDFNIVFNKSLNLDQDEAYAGKDLSDIRTKDVCHICDLPSDVELSHMIFKKETFGSSVIVLVSIAVAIAGVFALRKQKFL
jgi:GR25 family glycosyltransferase involved in LPS biosynthesis